MLVILGFISYSTKAIWLKCDVEKCSQAVHDWFLWNGLTLNIDKTDVLLLVSAAMFRHINLSNAVSIAGADVSLIEVVKSLGVTYKVKLTTRVFIRVHSTFSMFSMHA